MNRSLYFEISNANNEFSFQDIQNLKKNSTFTFKNDSQIELDFINSFSSYISNQNLSSSLILDKKKTKKPFKTKNYFTLFKKKVLSRICIYCHIS